MKHKSIYIYYILLLLILVSWVDQINTPNMILRLAFISAVIVPAFIKIPNRLPAIIACFFTISLYGYSRSYMPTEQYIYAIVVGIVAIINRRRLNDHLRIHGLVFLVLLYTTFINLSTAGKIANIDYSLLIIIFFSYFYSPKSNLSDIKAFSLSFSICSIVLSLIFLIMKDKFVVTLGEAGMKEGLERIMWTDPNYLGMVVGMGIMCSIIQLIMPQKLTSFEKVIYSTTIGISLVMLALNASRSAVLAVAVGFIYLILFSKIKTKYKFLIVIATIAFIAFLYFNKFLDTLLIRFLNEESASNGRTYVWQAKLNAFFNGDIKHKIFGFGYDGGIQLAFTGGYGFHNDYIAFLCEYGIIGLVLFILMFVTPAILVRKNVKIQSYVISLILFLAVSCFTLEPLSSGLLTFYFFYFFIFLFSKATYTTIR